jgi:Holliday junction resolvase RusA-like endonuclease
MIRLELFDVPPSLNEWTRMHWSKQRKQKQAWLWEVISTALNAKVGKPRYKQATIKITYYFTQQRRRDTDNYTPKFLMDSLVHVGIIQDDRADWVKVSWDFATGPKRKTTIEVWEGFDEQTGPDDRDTRSNSGGLAPKL